jgi:hypothetical protein
LCNNGAASYDVIGETVMLKKEEKEKFCEEKKKKEKPCEGKKILKKEKNRNNIIIFGDKIKM